MLLRGIFRKVCIKIGTLARDHAVVMQVRELFICSCLQNPVKVGLYNISLHESRNNPQGIYS